MTAKIKVALVMGGRSGEREVSVASGREVLEHIDRQRYEVTVYDPAVDLVRFAQDAPDIDVAFLALHGTYGEDGTMQGFCELLGVKYIGSGVLASAMAMDKLTSKQCYRSHGLAVARDLMVTDRDKHLDQVAARAFRELGSTVVVKPLRAGSSLGMSMVEKESELPEAIKAALEYDGVVLLEEYLEGQEFTCGVVGNHNLVPLPLIEIIPAEGHRFFDFYAKYEPGHALEVCPAEVSVEVTLKIQQQALVAHQALGCKGLSRSDFISTRDQVYILETNTLPGLTCGSLLPKMAQAYGIPFTSFISYLIDLAWLEAEVNLDDYRCLAV